MKETVISGIGVICNQGTGWNDIRKNAIKGKEKFEEMPDEIAKQISKKYKIGRIGDYNKDKYFNSRQLRLVDKFLTMSVAATGLALEDANIKEIENDEKDEIATIIGTSRPEFAGFQRFSKHVFLKQPQKLNPIYFPLLARSAACGQIAITFGFRGYSTTISVNNLSGMHSIARGVDLIRNGRAQIVVAGGIESLSHLSLAHNISLYDKRIDYPESKFFDKSEGRIVPSEGACILILEEREHAKKRGAKAYAQIDSYQIGRYEDHNDLCDAIEDILSLEQNNWNDIDIVGCSATGGGMRHDIDEKDALIAMKNKTNFCPVLSAPKALFGEAEAASSALQVAVVANALANNEIFPTPGISANSDLPNNIPNKVDYNKGLTTATDNFKNYAIFSLSKYNGNNMN